MGVQTPWLKRDEAAEYCRVGRPTLDRWIKAHPELKHKVPGLQSVRFHKDELDDFLRGHPELKEDAPSTP